MTSRQPQSDLLSFNFDNTQFGIRVKCPKVSFGPLELGVAATYLVADADDDGVLLRLDRFRPSLTVKDAFIRGKFELEPHAGKVHFSKKIRLPFLSTELFRLRLTAQLPRPQASSGLLGRALGVTITRAADPLYRKSVLRKAPQYGLQVIPRIGPPQSFYDDIGFPGSVYFKTNSMLYLSDANSVRGLRAHVDVRSFSAVVRLYDSRKVKPCRLGRNLAHAARRLTLEDAEGEEEARNVYSAVQVARVLEATEPPQPDIIDKGAAKVREWAHAILVNSCVATRYLQERAGSVSEQLLGRAAGGKPAAVSG